MVMKSIIQAKCLIIPTTFPSSTDEVHQMMARSGITSINVFPSFLSRLFDKARRDPAFLDELKGLESINYGGSTLDSADVAWAREQGLVLQNIMASTEVGLIMYSRNEFAGEEFVMQPYLENAGDNYEFVSMHSESAREADSKDLLELVVLPCSPDIPHKNLCDPATGKFHTGDLYTEIRPGRYLSQGRRDNWIKMDRALRCDAGSLERNALETCGGDLISGVVVVGSSRPSPVMFVEPRDGSDTTDSSALSEEILRRIKPFHERRYDHERIENARCIVVVPKGSLPRTSIKDTIQRKAVEVSHRQQIDQIFA